MPLQLHHKIEKKRKETLIGIQGQEVKLPKLKVEIFNRKMPGF
jgi:hypothetical protein